VEQQHINSAETWKSETRDEGNRRERAGDKRACAQVDIRKRVVMNEARRGHKMKERGRKNELETPED